MSGESGLPAGIHVWYSNQLERLAARLICKLAPTGDPSGLRLFRRPAIIVPNRNIETYLKYEIAKGAGIAAGLNFQVTQQFLRELVEKPDKKPAPKLANTSVLRAMFLDILADETDEARPLPEAVRTYIEAGGAERGARDLRRFQLAACLAHLAGRYGDTRPELTRTWDEGHAKLEGGPFEPTERWQRDLWARLDDPVGPIARARQYRDVAWILPPRLFQILHANPPEMLEPVHFFGFSYLWHGLRELIELLGKCCDVHIYTLCPFVPFDRDRIPFAFGIPISPGSPRRPGKGASAKSRDDLLPAILPDMPIVAQWGIPSREYFEVLEKVVRKDLFHPDFEPTGASTVLGRLQREILVGTSGSETPFQPDSSLTILACTGIRREAEVVANEIWRLISPDSKRKDTSVDRLRFRDIAVLIADTANRPTYQAHFRAIFEELHRIPFNMVDLALAGECQTIEAVLLLLALPLGEFTRPELLKILTHPAVRARFPEVDIDRWRDWCLGLEIVHGADRRDHDETYIDREAFHWDQGMRRLALGAFMTGPRQGDDRVFRLEDAEYLPYDIPADGVADAARLLVLVRSLVADARFARSARLTMTEWSEFLVRVVNGYLAADTDAEQRALSQCLQKIQGLRDLDVAGRAVGYRIACESLREALKDLTGSRGHYLADGVVISPLLAMRALPFRIVFLCGLGEGRFPAADGPDPLDLTLAGRMPGDVTPRERDKYLFLETLACAREKLYLSYVAKDAQTGDDIEPSPLVHELLRHLAQGPSGRPMSDWVEKQPMRRFDDSYFSDDSNDIEPGELRFSVSPAAWKESRARSLRKSLCDHLGHPPRLAPEMLYELLEPIRRWLGLCPITVAEPASTVTRRLEISFRDIKQFLQCPLQGWARLMLQLREDDEENESAREDEPFVIGRLGESTLLREVFFDALGRDIRGDSCDVFAPLYDNRAESWARRGLMPVGLFKDAERRRHLACLAGWHQAARRGNLLGAGRFLIHRFGRAREDERVERLESSIPLNVPLTDGLDGRSVVRVELFGRTELVAQDLPGSMTPVVRDQANDKDFLSGFLDAVILSLVPGHHDPAQYHAHVIASSRAPDVSTAHRVLWDIDESRARRFLTDVVGDLLGRPHAYLLPCEAVFAHLLKGTPIAESVQKMKENDRTACSSRYGPVPNIEQYRAPDEDEAREMIDRRFGLFRASGGIG